MIVPVVWNSVIISSTSSGTTGFQREGVMREAFRHGSEYRSLILMSLLEAERVGVPPDRSLPALTATDLPGDLHAGLRLAVQQASAS